MQMLFRAFNFKTSQFMFFSKINFIYLFIYKKNFFVQMDIPV